MIKYGNHYKNQCNHYMFMSKFILIKAGELGWPSFLSMSIFD